MANCERSTFKLLAESGRISALTKKETGFLNPSNSKTVLAQPETQKAFMPCGSLLLSHCQTGSNSVHSPTLEKIAF